MFIIVALALLFLIHFQQKINKKLRSNSKLTLESKLVHLSFFPNSVDLAALIILSALIYPMSCPRGWTIQKVNRLKNKGKLVGQVLIRS